METLYFFCTFGTKTENQKISNEYVTIYLVCGDIDISKIKLQQEEVSEAKWCSREELNQLIQKQLILPHIRDLAMLELLISTGMRVGELTRLNISDLNLQARSCVVLGKGNSEREVYFNAKSKMYIEKYLETRTDNNEALFVSLIKPYNRLKISGIEI